MAEVESNSSVEPHRSLKTKHRRSHITPDIRWLAVPIVLGVFSLLTVGYLNSFTPVKVMDGDLVIEHRTHQTTVSGLLNEIGLPLLPEDIVFPRLEASLVRNDTIVIRRAKLVKLTVDDQEPRWIRTQRDLGRDFLNDLGYRYGVHDELLVNGQFNDQLTATLKPKAIQTSPPEARVVPDASLEFRRAVPMTIQEHGNPAQTIQTTARTVGEALLQAGYMLYLADRVSPNPGDAAKPNMFVTIERARPVTIWVDGRQIRTRSLHSTVGDVLAEMNVILYGEDYAHPALDVPIAANDEIRVVRVKREVHISQEFIPFKTLWQADPELELDTQIVAQDGAPGVHERRSMVTFENGLEVKRELIADFIARQPQPKIHKYGTRVVIRTLNTPSGPVQYWRKIRMLATSYSASTAGVPKTNSFYGRARCGMVMRHGIVAVDPHIVNLRTNVYVPDYGPGFACDTGGAIKGKRIDLGYDDDNLKLWYRWVDVYLLTPAPANFPARLD
jgi:uncharacterized protein YabE (DUF348 family)